MSDKSLVEGRCESVSPIVKFDGGPIRCEAKAGHKGVHYGTNYDVSYDVAPGGRQRRWDDEGRLGWAASRD